MRRSKLWWSVLGALVLAGCAGGDDDADTANSSTIAPATSSAPTTSTTAAPATTTTARATTTTVEPTTTTTDPGERFRDLFAELDPAMLELVAPGTGAWLYADASLRIAPLFPAPAAGDLPLFDNFVLDDTGLIVDFDREGVPLSSTVFGVPDLVASGGDALALFHSVRYFEGRTQFAAVIDNTAGTNTAYFQWESLVTSDGRQFEVFPIAIPTDGVRAGATSIVMYYAETDAPGGTLVGRFIGGDELVVVLPG